MQDSAILPAACVAQGSGRLAKEISQNALAALTGAFVISVTSAFRSMLFYGESDDETLKRVSKTTIKEKLFHKSKNRE
ncbi:MAG: hypothetical protein CVV32_01100 [Methanomicrobiales archaeon HGW-Methanomicrobiales-3]|nr:MAG: hypothetical protein CVV32_01100 [Methanomicrobiales archaeon HGW-Methanomicrobiales-3]